MLKLSVEQLEKYLFSVYKAPVKVSRFYPLGIEKKVMAGRDLKDFEIFLEHYADKIIEKWINYFVYHKDVVFEKISKKIR